MKRFILSLMVLVFAVPAWGAQTTWEQGCRDPDGVAYRWVVNYGAVMRADLPNLDQIVLLHCSSSKAIVLDNDPFAMRAFDVMATKRKRYTFEAVQRRLAQKGHHFEQLSWKADTCLCSDEVKTVAFNLNPKKSSPKPEGND